MSNKITVNVISEKKAVVNVVTQPKVTLNAVSKVIPYTVTISENEPINPKNNDIWFQIQP